MNTQLEQAFASFGIGREVNAKRKELIKEMEIRFLRWKFPKDFHPDGGISFSAPEKHQDALYEPWPVGTNLLTGSQAFEMLAFVTKPLLDEIDRLRKAVADK